MLTTRQQLEPILEEFTRLKAEWKFDENKGREQLLIGLFITEYQEDMLIAYGRFRQCVDLIAKMS